MSKKKKQAKSAADPTSRRDFFKVAGLSAAGAAVAAAGADVPEAQAAETSPHGRGYQLTDHVKKAYQASRF